MSGDYDPVECLREEVARFKATNKFTPMLVTGFYVQAGVVLDELDSLRKELEETSLRLPTTAHAMVYMSLKMKYDTAETLLRDIHKTGGLLRADETRDLWHRLEAWVKTNTSTTKPRR